MPAGVLRVLLRLAALCLAAAAIPAWGQDFAPGSVCHAAARMGESYAELAADPARWSCVGRVGSIAPPRHVIRFDLRGGDPQAPPSLFVTRLARFSRLTLTTIDADGRSAASTFRLDDMRPAASDWQMTAPLPGRTAGAQAVIVTIDRPRLAALLGEARLARPADRADPGQDLALAALCGLLFAPLLFNLAFYRALRESFLLWHAVVVAFMLAQTVLTSGLVNRLATLPPSWLELGRIWTFGAAVGAAAMFSAAFIEADRLDARHRRALRLTVGLVAALMVLYTMPGEIARVFAPLVYFPGYVAVLGVFTWVMAVAARRGSRAVMFQIAAWAPIMLTGLARAFANLVGAERVLDAQWAQHLSIAAEVLITTFGVADRFMVIRRERDVAQTQAQALETEARALATEADHDPLTGLRNRRALSERFAEFHAAGFRSMAVLDIDHFKQVNDRHGHATGDEVLRSVADALAPDHDTIALRMGGEEFLLLLRGGDVVARAERRRQAITARAAAAVPGLEALVTASMGLVECDARGGLTCEFATLYEHCDRLLYEAKRAGRNRTMHEKIKAFAEGRRRPAAA